jgi:hypothetical protein
MDPAVIDILAPMLFAVILTLTVGGVILLKPISKKIGDLLEAMAEERKNPSLTTELHQLRGQLDTMSSRMALLEERQDFHEKLMEAPSRLPAIESGSGGAKAPQSE